MLRRPRESDADAVFERYACDLEEFRAVRAATVTFFQGLPTEAWTCSGVASDNRFTVRAMAYIIAGHVTTT